MAENLIGGSGMDPGASPDVGRYAGGTNVNARTRSAIDPSAFKELNTEFSNLNKHLVKHKQELPEIVKKTKEWASALRDVSNSMSSIAGGKGGGPYIPNAGSIASGNTTIIQKIFNAPGAGGPGGGGGGGIGGGISPMGGGRGAAAVNVFDALANMVGAGLGAMDSRIAQNLPYALSADKMSMVYQQMSGLSRGQVQQQYRDPLKSYTLGTTGINDLLAYQARTGISAQLMAPSIEAMRVSSGFGYSTSDLLTKAQNLSSPQSVNRMFMTMGTGIYGIGGTVRTPTQVYQDIIQRTGLTNESYVRGAFQQGSFQRERLRTMGLPEDQIDDLLMYAQQNVNFQKKTGGKQGFYDPSNKEQQRLMGISENYAMQNAETERVKTNREENFQARQVENFAIMEQKTQEMVGFLENIDKTLASAYGLAARTKPQRDTLGSAWNIGKRVLGFGAMAVGGAMMLAPGAGTMAGAALFAGGSALATGDPEEKSGRGAPRGMGATSTAYTGGKKEDTPNIKKSSAKLATLNPKFADRLKDMMRDNPRLTVSSAKRSSEGQKRMFLERYVPTDEQTSTFYAGSYWKHVKGAAAAPPGLSMHEIGLAADLHGDENWVAANAHKYGLKSFFDSSYPEPWHVQPKEFPFGRAKYEKIGAPWGTSGEKFDPSTIWNSVSATDVTEAQIAAGSGETSPGGMAGSFAWSDMAMRDIVSSSTMGGSGSTGGEGGGGSVSSSASSGSSSGSSTGGGGALSGPEIAKLMYNAGFRGPALKRAIAIAWRESRFNPKTIYETKNEKSFGLMQINMIDKAVPGLSGGGMGKQRLKRFRLNSAEDLLDPATNARVAYELWSGQTSGEGNLPPARWGPWGGAQSADPKQVQKAETYIREAKLPEGDPVASSGRSSAFSSASSNALYNINVSPTINITSSMGSPAESQRVAREVASLLEREVRMTMMRTS